MVPGRVLGLAEPIGQRKTRRPTPKALINPRQYSDKCEFSGHNPSKSSATLRYSGNGQIYLGWKQSFLDLANWSKSSQTTQWRNPEQKAVSSIRDIGDNKVKTSNVEA
ncbi:hypothetical protein CIRG_06249 [Coccidioides immitis RMSCC 2394]|uniref:Uncharacterized protein n=1 Tax=Coccidioides immitis RMSCC 2394 TaxID=404692 RepID=A0A0J6YI40_COCIT|nr:hypothetical protein CIRG_06249 [Coccidioides immitis RMSCC 2394]